jgi:tetraacyldisaccharide 4'-kinase
MGGSGKTPLIIYLYHLLNRHVHIATLSRGYGRKSTDNRIATPLDTSLTIGDEPMIFVNNLPDAVVAVAKNRLEGIEKIMQHQPETRLVLLDDAYQYLSLRPDLSILLTDYYHPYTQDYVFPAGNLRERRKEAQYADIIIVTKTPNVLPPIDRMRFIHAIRPQKHQSVYFSYVAFGTLQPITDAAKSLSVDTLRSVVAVAAIAEPYPFFAHIRKHFADVQTRSYADHHQFTQRNVKELSLLLNKTLSENKAIVTTEKDAVRWLNDTVYRQVNHLPVFYLPITMQFHEEDKYKFNNQIIEYVTQHGQTGRANG